MAVKNAIENSGTDQQIDVSARAKHEVLKQKLNDATARQAWWEKWLDEEPVKEMLFEFEKTIENCRAGLETAKGDDVKRLQADVHARRGLKDIIESKASKLAVDSARRELREFERDNGLFLHANKEAAN